MNNDLQTPERIPDPVGNFVYSEILKHRAHFLSRQLFNRFQDEVQAITGDEPPECDFLPADPGISSTFTLSAEAVAGLFLYHFISMSEQPEMNGEECAWIAPYLEAFLAGEEKEMHLTPGQQRFLLWLYEKKRLPLALHDRLVVAFAHQYNEEQYNELLRLQDPDGMAASWNRAFAAMVERDREKSEAKEAARMERVRLLRAQREQEAEENRALIAKVKDYRRNPAAYRDRFDLMPNHPDVAAVVTALNLRGVLDKEHTLWISGSGRLSTGLLRRIPEEQRRQVQVCILGEGIVHLNDGTFYYADMEDIRAVHLPQTLKNIRKEAFLECERLAYIPLPKHLHHIGPKAFGGCKALTRVRLPDTLKSLHGTAFQGSGLRGNMPIPAGCRITLDGSALGARLAYLLDQE